AHVEAVREFLGRGALMRKGIFLADGNALALSQARLEAMFEIAKAAFPGHAIYSFVDLFTGERRPVSGWRRLAELGLKRVYIGMETGHDELLRFSTSRDRRRNSSPSCPTSSKPACWWASSPWWVWAARSTGKPTPAPPSEPLAGCPSGPATWSTFPHSSNTRDPSTRGGGP